MNLTTCLALALATTLVGCAAPGYRIEPDHARINAIDRVALKRGVQVVWVNAPVRAVKVEAGT